MAEQNSSPLIQIVFDVVSALMTMVEEKDAGIRGHSERVALHCLNLARRLKLPKRDCEMIHLAGMLHDIGMVYVPDEIILANGEQLSQSGQVLMRRHPVQAEKILSRISIFKGILPIIRHHHEYFDGSGYPDGIKDEKIPLGARIMCMADHFDRMTVSLTEKPAMGIEDALIFISDNRGVIFDPVLVPEFTAMIKATCEARQGKDDDGIVKKVVTKIISKFESGVIGLPVLPTIVQRIRETIAAPNYSIDALAKLLELDAVISVRLIAVANSVVYRGREKVQTVRQAVPRLGTKETDNIVMAIVNRNLYQTEEKELQGLMERLWKHSLATAFCARLIAERLRLGEQESYFTMGLIHDIGKVPLLQGISTLRARGDETMKALDYTTIENILKDAHEHLGADLLKKWEFSEPFVRTAKMHEQPALNEETPKTILVVHLANILTRTIGLSAYSEEVLDLNSIESARLLGLNHEALTEIAQETKKLVDASSNMF